MRSLRVSSVVLLTVAALSVRPLTGTADGFLDVNVCFSSPIFSFENGLPVSEFYGSFTFSSAAAMLAVEHVNNQDCTIVGPGCEKLLRPGGKRLKITPSLYDLHDQTPRLAGHIAIHCAQAGGQYLVGAMSSGQSSVTAAFAAANGQLLMSSTATSPSLSDKVQYPAFVRTAFSDEAMAVSITDFALEMGWKQVACLHNQDLFGNAFAEVFSKHMHQRGMKTLSLSLGATQTETEIADAMTQLKASGIKVAVIVAFQRSYPLIMKTASSTLDDFRSYTWFAGGVGVADVISNNIAVLNEEPETASLMEGLIGTSVLADYPRAVPLEATLKTFDTQFRHYLEEHYVVTDKITGTPADTCGALTSSIPDNTDGQPFELPPTNESLANGVAALYTLQAYDSIWALAAGITTAVNELDLQCAPTGDEVLSMIRGGRMPVFYGARGRNEFDTNGDPSTEGLTLQFSNYARHNGGSEASTVVVGSWTSTAGALLSSEQPVVWSDGSTYPKVPLDGSSSSSRTNHRAWLIFVACLLGTLLLLSLWMIRRTRQLSARLQELQFVDLDIDTPLSKIIEFLKRHSNAWRLGYFSGPSKQEAAALLQLVIRSSGSLTTPDIQHQIDTAPSVASDMARFVIEEYTRNNSSTIGRGSPGRRWSISNLDEDSSHGLGRRRSMDEAAFAAYSAEPLDVWLKVPVTQTIAKILEYPLTFTVPDNTQHIGSDFFIDFVSENSILKSCPSPLAVVAKQCLRQMTIDNLFRRNSYKSCFIRFSVRVELGYPSEHYHCREHVCDVTNRLTTLLTKSGIASAVGRDNQYMMLAALVAAMIHDYEHPQVNNHFLVDQRAQVSVDFNDQAVAENHSVKHGLHLLEDEHMNFIRGWRDTDRKHFRRIVIETVLATEMSRHFDILTQFSTKVVENPDFVGLSSVRKWMTMSPDLKLLTLQTGMKVADLGHCALPFDQHCKWIARLQEEFFLQGDEEREKNRAISMFMDRTKKGVYCGENQVGFFKFIALPLFSAWCKAFPECKPLLVQAEENNKRWTQLAAQDAAKTFTGEKSPV